MYKIEMWCDGRWCALGGTYATTEEARAKIAQFMMTGVRKRTRSYRVVMA